MTLNFSLVGKVKITMVDYIQNMLDELSSNMDSKATTPATNHLFDINEATTDMLLDRETAKLYHQNVAKLLFLCKWTHPDIQTAVSFLCTRVKNPDTDDYKKLAHIMHYLHGTLNMPLMLEANDVRVSYPQVAHEGTHRRQHDPWQRIRLRNINQTENQHLQFHGSRIG
jgi:hypothetical protein